MTYLTGRSDAIFIVTVVTLCISFVAVCLRCYVRLALVKAFGWDDGVMVFAMALNIWFAVCGIVGTIHGVGQKFADLALDDMETALMWWWLGQVSYVLTCMAAKISIAMSLLRLTFRKIHNVVLWSVIAVTIAVGFAFWFVLLLQCNPISHFWNRFGEGTCINVNITLLMAYIYSVTAAVSDFTMGILPIALVRKLHMNGHTKWALAGILSMGCVASVAVVVRIPFIKDYKDPDFLYATAQIAIWSYIEASLGITAGSLSTLRPLFRGSKFGSSERSRGTQSRSASANIGLSNMSNKKHGPDMDKPGLWRPDLKSMDENGGTVPAMVTTINCDRDPEDHDHAYLRWDSRGTSEENLTPKEAEEFPRPYGGVNVQKTFYVSSTEV